MSQHPKPRVLALALLALVFLLPAITTAQPREAVPAVAARHDVGPSLFAQLRSLLSALWKTGSILEPNGAKPDPSAGSGIVPTSDTGSILEPNG